MATHERGAAFALAHLPVIAAASAFLLIAIQPAAALAVLPATGGSPALWHALQGLFQLLLLAGYALAGLLFGRRSRSVTTYAYLMWAGAAAALAAPDTLADPAVVTLGPLTAAAVVALNVGVAFCLLATCSVAIQIVYWRTTAGRSPFWLYAASNAGSLAGVLAYPLVIEPRVDVSSQLWWWRLGSIATLIVLGSVTFRRRHSVPAPEGSPAGSGLLIRQRLLWVCGGFCSVGLSLACTTYLAVDLGSHPVVWLGPFSLYLITLIVAFSPRTAACAARIAKAAPFAIALLWAGLLTSWPQTLAGIALHLAGVAILLAGWHVWLASKRPDGDRLIGFYTHAISGGVMASAIVGFAAPAVFNPALYTHAGAALPPTISRMLVPEYALLVLASLLIVADATAGVSPKRDRILSLAEGGVCAWVAFACVTPAIRLVSGGAALSTGSIAAAIGVGAAVVLLRSRAQLVPALVGVALLSAFESRPSAQVVEQRRSLFGTLRITDAGTWRTLLHGTTVHGVQPLSCINGTDAARCAEPTAYYHRSGPIARVIETAAALWGRSDAAVIGLGAGTLAAYCGPIGRLSFLEIDPGVVSVAERRFRYLETGRSRCASLDVDVGDARVVLRARRDRFDLLIADAFSSDTVPAHLLTREALREYGERLRSDGVIMFHISNRYFELEHVIARNAGLLDLEALAVSDDARSPGTDDYRLPSTWVLVARGRTFDAFSRALSGGAGGPAFRRRALDLAGRAWTDQRHSLFDVLRRRSPSEPRQATTE